MQIRQHIARSCSFFLFLLAFSSAHTSDEKRVYTFGVVPQYDARHLHQVWRPILTQLENRTGFKFRLIGSRSIPEFEVQFMAGEFDFAYMNPYHALQATESKLYIPLARDVSRKLYGILVARSDSPIQDLQELQNQTIVFPAPNAIGASLIPRADLKNRFKIDINPKYVQSHSSVYLHIALGRAIAGGGVQKTLAQQPKHIREKLKVIYKTREFAPHPLMASTRIESDISTRVKKAFLEMGNNVTEKALLAKIPISEVGEAKLSDYLTIKDWGLEAFYVR